MNDETSQQEGRVGFVALVGRPNVGKSTLLNTILGQKLAIVSPRPQTTRNRILGVRTIEQDQIVLVDTPGIHRKRQCVNAFMVREALASLEGVDCVVLVTEIDRDAERSRNADSFAIHPEDQYVLRQVRPLAPKAPLVLAINKIDLAGDKRWLLPLMDRWQAEGFSSIVPISARDSDGVDRLLDEVRERLPAGPHLYPEDMLTDRAERFLAAELVREQVFACAREEVPHSTAVEVEQFEERADRGDVRIAATIFVERDSQKAILIGSRGERIKQIGTEARNEVSQLLGCKVHLALTVRVAEDWTRSPSGRRRFGYE